MIGFFHHVSNGFFDGGLVFETLLTHLYIIGVLLSRTDTGFQDMWTICLHEVNCRSLIQCVQTEHIDSVRVTADLDLTFCQATVKSGKCCFSVLTK